MVEVSNGRNCGMCNKANVCKYRDIAIEEVEKIKDLAANIKAPLTVNVGCLEFESSKEVKRLW